MYSYQSGIIIKHGKKDYQFTITLFNKEQNYNMHITKHKHKEKLHMNYISINIPTLYIVTCQAHRLSKKRVKSLTPCLVAARSPGWFVGDPTSLAFDNIVINYRKTHNKRPSPTNPR